MAKKSKKEVKEVSRTTLENGTVIVKFEDGSIQIIPAPVVLSPEEASSIFGEEDEDEDEDEEEEEEEDEDEDEDDEEDEDDDSDEDDEDNEEDEDGDDEDEDEDEDDEEEEEEEEEITPESLAGMDFEELEDVCEDNDLDIDPDDYDEEEVEKLRKDVAKKLGITLPKKGGKGKSSKKSKK